MKNYCPSEYLAFLGDFFDLLKRLKIELTKYELYPQVSQNEIDAKLKEGSPLINLKKVCFPSSLQEIFLKEFIYLNKKYSWGNSVEAENIVDSKKLKINIMESVEKVISVDDEYFEKISKEIGLMRELLVFFVEGFASSLLEVIALRFNGKISDKFWGKNFCPVCGSIPRMSKLEKDEGKRFLLCSLCNSIWAFKRLECPFCFNRDQEKLKFFYLEDESPYRVDVCLECKRYIKTIDERKKAGEDKISTFVEDKTTFYLDLFAEREGFKKS